jgi:hypothetical protein
MAVAPRTSPLRRTVWHRGSSSASGRLRLRALRLAQPVPSGGDRAIYRRPINPSTSALSHGQSNVATSTSALFGIYRWGWGFSTSQDFNGDMGAHRVLRLILDPRHGAALARRSVRLPAPMERGACAHGQCAPRHAPLDRHGRGHLPDGVASNGLISASGRVIGPTACTPSSSPARPLARRRTSPPTS